MIQQQESLDAFLDDTKFINWRSPLVSSKAAELAGSDGDVIQIVRNCFQFVRDEIRHSGDYQLSPTTCRASDVLHHATGWCYAKSHLLAALLRASGIPAGLCYQRLSISGDGPPYSLHGLNAAHLPGFGWYRFDARGNKPGVEAEFTPPKEKLAFRLRHPAECDLPEIWPTPHPAVLSCLLTHADHQSVLENLPDITLISTIAPKS